MSHVVNLEGQNYYLKRGVCVEELLVAAIVILIAGDFFYYSLCIVTLLSKYCVSTVKEMKGLCLIGNLKVYPFTEKCKGYTFN